jgi:mRNA interferase MazF
VPAEPTQRDVWFADLDPVQGHEQGGRRPVIVLSVDALSERGLAVVMPTTTTDRGSPLHLLLEPPEGGLRERSFALPEMVRSIATSRLVARRCSVRPSTHVELVRRLRVITQPTS